jgi:hypothetical protein
MQCTVVGLNTPSDPALEVPHYQDSSPLVRASPILPNYGHLRPLRDLADPGKQEFAA